MYEKFDKKKWNEPDTKHMWFCRAQLALQDALVRSFANRDAEWSEH